MNLNKFQTNALPFLPNVRDMSNFMWDKDWVQCSCAPGSLKCGHEIKN